MESEQPVEQPAEEPAAPSPEPVGEGQHVDFRPTPPAQKRRPVWLWILIGLAIVAVVVAAAMVFKPKDKTAQKTSTSQSSSSQPSDKPGVNVPTKSYQSTTFNLSFDYPEQWKVNDTGTPPLTVVSPVMTLTDPAGQKMQGEVVMTILPQGQVPDRFGNGNATAVLASQKISYTKPTPSQRAQTYLSFVQYETTAAHGALDGIYITGNVGYTKGQPIPKADIAARDPDVNVTFIKCANSTCNGSSGPTNVAATIWNDQNFQAPITTMLTSLAFD